jgi:hypothetical protein
MIRWFVRGLARLWEAADWWLLILKTCGRGHHAYDGFTDGKRIVYVCQRCLKQTKHPWKVG